MFDHNEKKLWQEINKDTKVLKKNIVESRQVTKVFGPPVAEIRDYSFKKESDFLEKIDHFCTQRKAIKQNFCVEKLKQKQAKKIFPKAMIDLHGHTRAESEVILKKLLYKSQICNFDWIKIITGKSGVLFDFVPELLAENAVFVSSYVYAGASDGGTGAIYVRIRKYIKRNS